MKDSTHLKNLISEENRVQKDFRARLKKARNVFTRSQLIWKPKQSNLRTKIILYNSNAKSVLLQCLECCGIFKGDMEKIDAFGNGCIRKICVTFFAKQEKSLQETKCQIVVSWDQTTTTPGWLRLYSEWTRIIFPKVVLRQTPPSSKRGKDQKNLARDCLNRDGGHGYYVLGTKPYCSG